MAERLRTATSPYLLQHADNPVDWWPWCEEAFEEARRRDVPVLLSVGYSACHWCHVMAHESFEDEKTAELVNDLLVPVKVDREERPDVDAVYMAATQAMTGQGGWPMTVFLTPGREPFYCGTYFPRDQLRRLVLAVARAWRDERAEVGDQARKIAAALAESSATTSAAASAGSAAGAGPVSAELCESAVAGLQAVFDSGRGGFGGAPKFPPSMVLEFLLRHGERARGSRSASAALAMATLTAQAMARGGIYDQLAGGFARYSTDAEWIVPHFEKMLYDNALLARAYAHLWRSTGSDLAGRVTRQTCDWMIADLRTREGGLASALDADSDGEEGAYYVWTPAQFAEVLGVPDGEYAARTLRVGKHGSFGAGRSVPCLPADPDDPDRFARARAALAGARALRERPARDDKVVAAWNGLAIAALAEAGVLAERTEYLAAARTAAGLLASVHLSADSAGHARLARTSRDGIAGPSEGILEDYACVAQGFLVLSGVTGEQRWAGLAGDLLDAALARFGSDDGVFYDTAADSEKLIFRPAQAADGPTPSGTFALAEALLSYAALTGSPAHREAALLALAPLPEIAARYPGAAGSGLAVAEAVLSGPAEIAVVGPAGDQRTQDLLRAAVLAAPPGAVLASGPGDGGDGSAPGFRPGLLDGRGLVGGAPAAYVCRDFACRAPVTDPESLRAALTTMPA